MYRKTNDGQLDIYDFILPFGGHLKEYNRWVKLRQTINWELVEEEYCRNFANKDAGQEAYPADVAFGSLYIRRLLGFTDLELVDQIAENPYMQYFIGYKEYRNERPFDPSLLVAFRKRLPVEPSAALRKGCSSAGRKRAAEGIVMTTIGIPKAAGIPTAAAMSPTTGTSATAARMGPIRPIWPRNCRTKAC